MRRSVVTLMPLLPVLVAAALVATGCGGNDTSVVRTPEASPTSKTPQSPSPATSASAPTSSPVVRHPKAKVEPRTGLRDGQVVTVTASGFSPALSLVVIECADKGKDTGQGDCNLAVSTVVTTDAAGRATAQLKVARGPFGSNNVVCSATLHCLVSVTEASFNPTEEADTPIGFG